MSEERASTRCGNQVSFLLVEMEGFGTRRARLLMASGLAEDVREVYKRICALVEEVGLLGQTDRFTGQRLGLIDVPAPGKNASADGSPDDLGE